jgi:hypothetical protein
MYTPEREPAEQLQRLCQSRAPESHSKVIARVTKKVAWRQEHTLFRGEGAREPFDRESFV